MTNKADDHNPLLSTPVATVAAHIAAGLAAGAVADTRTFASNLGKEMAARAEMSVTMAELVVQHLQERSHLPRTIAVDEEPKADDATLILQALLFGVARWESLSDGDPRGELVYDGIRHFTKLIGGVPRIDADQKARLSELVAPFRRNI